MTYELRVGRLAVSCWRCVLDAMKASRLLCIARRRPVDVVRIEDGVTVATSTVVR